MIPADNSSGSVGKVTSAVQTPRRRRALTACLSVMMSYTFPYMFAIFMLCGGTFAARTCTVPDLSFEPACDAGMLFIIVTASHEIEAFQHNVYVSSGWPEAG